MGRKNQVEGRQKRILELLEQNEEVSLGFLCKELSCSETTTRNDLRILEQHGMLRRTFGGAIRTDETPTLWLNISVREQEHIAEKRDIARYVVDHLLRPGMTIVLDAGTTCAVLAQEIAKKRLKLRVITNSFHAAVALAPALDVVELYMIGGMYNPVSGSLYDEFQLEVIQQLRADLFFMGTDAVSVSDGFTIMGLSGLSECTIKRGILNLSHKTYVLADHSKFGRTTMKLVCSVDSVDAVITDAGVNKLMAEDLQSNSVPVIIAGKTRKASEDTDDDL